MPSLRPLLQSSFLSASTLFLSSIFLSCCQHPLSPNKTTKENKIVETPVLLDTRAGGIFMNKAYAKKHSIELYKLDSPIVPCNVDGTLNQAGKIMHYTWIQTNFQDITILVWLLITNIGSQDIIFGLPWFQDYNPQVNFVTGKITIQKKAKTDGWSIHAIT